MSDSIIELRELQKDSGADFYFQKQPLEKMTDYVGRFMEFVEGGSAKHEIKRAFLCRYRE